ncbi:hypothetical protein SPI_03508 [Niveomyces insectorum RCEF 264]|uniref:Uncharacterized protein n=1 Tax=Niveomyces insectorum RCEF 264 TaxID=1081102 RepID=A0A167W4Y9_9HYPO|nr:hypothetical protein SPI_03508 [Niveomyces insectorum RCEF 264]
MPPYFDQAQIHAALRNQAIPTLEALAANEDVRNHLLRRFDRSDPPPYVSSTESSLHEMSPPRESRLPEDVLEIMERPITDEERNLMVFSYGLGSDLAPNYMYLREAKREIRRLIHAGRRMFSYKKGGRREGVMARHNIKHRWEKLGIWNPAWGFPGRNVTPEDAIFKWKWPWQQQNSGDDFISEDAEVQQLVRRALQLRQNLRRGEHAPVIPRSHPGPDTSASEGESFLISRPWFLFLVELTEEKIRFDRIDWDERRRYNYNPRTQVIKWWKERGDWREENREGWSEGEPTDPWGYWKWRHESPSPEPEDMTPIANNVNGNPLDAEGMDFTPSEIDDLEMIERATPEQPEMFWTKPIDEYGGTLPGQMLERPKPSKDTTFWTGEPSANPLFPLFRSVDRPPPPAAEPEVVPEENDEAPKRTRRPGRPPRAVRGRPPPPPPPPPGAEEEVPPEEDDSAPPKKIKRAGRPRNAVPGAASAAAAAAAPPPPQNPPRRSARIAGMKRAAEQQSPLPAASNKKAKTDKQSRAAASAAQPATRTKAKPRAPRGGAAAQPKRGPGRPKKQDPKGPSTVTKRKPTTDLAPPPKSAKRKRAR